MARRVPDASRQARVRLLMSFALTLNALVFTVFGAATHAGFTAFALAFTGAGVFASTWFLLDVGITWRAERERLRGSGGVTPMTGARRMR